jgi:hypothetical protein
VVVNARITSALSASTPSAPGCFHFPAILMIHPVVQRQGRTSNQTIGNKPMSTTTTARSPTRPTVPRITPIKTTCTSIPAPETIVGSDRPLPGNIGDSLLCTTTLPCLHAPVATYSCLKGRSSSQVSVLYQRPERACVRTRVFPCPHEYETATCRP